MSEELLAGVIVSGLVVVILVVVWIVLKVTK